MGNIQNGFFPSLSQVQGGFGFSYSEERERQRVRVFQSGCQCATSASASQLLHTDTHLYSGAWGGSLSRLNSRSSDKGWRICGIHA